MKKPTSAQFLIIIACLGLLAVSGCSYFNTYYNIKKKFREAEREYQRSSTAPAPAPGRPAGQPGQPGGLPAPPPQQRSVPIDRYRKVIETSAKLLEYYPKSRWVDDTLLLMGIAYYRMQDNSRAERKFTELMTIFPNSEHVPEAAIWKARVLIDQGKAQEATDLLSRIGSGLRDRQSRGNVEALLARTEFQRKRWDEAAVHFKLAAELLPAGEDRYEALYHYGLSQFERGEYRPSLDAFLDVARGTRKRERAFEAHVYSARASLATGDAVRAEQILRRLKQMQAFEAFASDVDLELANLAVQSGDAEEGIVLYQQFFERYPDAPRRGLAFLRLANVYREHHVDLTLAKAMLDSAIRTSGSREVTDSARALHDQITHGLQVLQQFKALEDSVAALDARRMLLGHEISQGAVDAPGAPTRVGSTAESEFAPGDTARQDGVPAPPRVTRDSPAAIAADSLVRSLMHSDTLAADIAGQAVDPDSIVTEGPGTAEAAEPAADPTQTAASRAEAELEDVNRRLASARARHHLMALRVAEFYSLSLQEPDSALVYYKLAASRADNAEVFWKANLYLAHDAAADSARVSEAHQYYRAVSAADSVPVPAANVARQALGLPLLSHTVAPQDSLFQVAEQASLTTGARADSVLRLYSDVIAYDSTSPAAMNSMFAQLYLYEHVLMIPDSAHSVGRRLVELFPDSVFAERLRTRLLPPDSNSVFMMTEEQLYPSLQPQESVLEETPSDGGWPPPEESLRGRRFE